MVHLASPENIEHSTLNTKSDMNEEELRTQDTESTSTTTADSSIWYS